MFVSAYLVIIPPHCVVFFFFVVLNVRVSSPLFIKGKATSLGLTFVPGPDLREGKLGSCPGPPQLGGLHK